MMVYTEYMIEELLQQNRSVIGPDFAGYRNHVYRVYRNCLLLDRQMNNREKYAIAAVFHDIGIWTHHTVDYLNPSIEQATAFLTTTGRQHLLVDVTQMIRWHHKIRPYRGPGHHLVETFRKADWIDVSFGILSFGTDRRVLRINRTILPNRGFHAMLLKKLLKNLLVHPTKPLPMFRI